MPRALLFLLASPWMIAATWACSPTACSPLRSTLQQLQPAAEVVTRLNPSAQLMPGYAASCHSQHTCELLKQGISSVELSQGGSWAVELAADATFEQAWSRLSTQIYATRTSRVSPDHYVRTLREAARKSCLPLPAALKVDCFEAVIKSIFATYQCAQNTLPQERIERSVYTGFLKDESLQELALMYHLVSPAFATLVTECHGQPLLAQKRCLEGKLPPAEKEKFLLRFRLWSEYQVIAMNQDLPVGGSAGVTREFSARELQRFLASYDLLKSRMQAKGIHGIERFSHIWGAPGFLIKGSELTLNGQFGEVDSHYDSMTTTVVVDVTITNVVNGKRSGPFTVETITQRIAHESLHSQDINHGRMNLNRPSFVSERAESVLYRLCQQVPDLEASLEFERCYATHRELFPTANSYAARNPMEFYASLMNRWASADGGQSYRCRSRGTQEIWRELEETYLGLSAASPCR